LWYRKAAKQGSVNAQNTLGSMYEDGKGVQQSFAEAAYWYRKAAMQGDADAQDNLLISISTDRVSCRTMLSGKLVSQSGRARPSQCASSTCRQYDSGQGVPQNYAEAASWYRKAAEQNNAGAQYNLGYMYAQAKAFR